LAERPEGRAIERAQSSLEHEPPDPWVVLLNDDLGIAVIRSDRTSASIDDLLSEPKDAPGP
jgi:hypothetical protein